jgi:hypothetical protein
MLEIREVTDGFVPPPDACTTYTVCLQELDAFTRSGLQVANPARLTWVLNRRSGDQKKLLFF